MKKNLLAIIYMVLSISIIPVSGQTYSQSTGTVSQTGKTYNSATDDLSAINVTGGTLNLSNSTISSSGNTSSSDNSSFYGLNAVILASTSSGTAVINSSDNTVSSTGVGANGIFAYGSASITTSDDKLTMTGGGGHAIMCSGGGTITVSNDTTITSGGSASNIATDRGGGTITVNGGSYTANGNNSAAVYSTGEITCTDATLIANGAEALVIEGSNYITLNNCDIKSTYNKWGSLVYQSMSGDASGSDGHLTINGGTFTYTGTKGGMFYNTNATAYYNLNNVTLNNNCDTLIMCIKGSWGQSTASSGGITHFTAKNQSLSGLIYVDANSSAYLTLQDSSALNGDINPDNIASFISLSMDSLSNWSLTANSYVGILSDTASIVNDSVVNITGNGYNVYYDQTQSSNSYLNGKTYHLKNGGYLEPSATAIEPLTITKVYTPSQNTVKVIFNEPVGVTAENVSNYTGLGTIASAKRSADLDTVTLSLDNALTNGESYTLTIANVIDSSGTETLATSNYTIIFNNSIANLVITEIMYMYNSTDNNTGGMPGDSTSVIPNDSTGVMPGDSTGVAPNDSTVMPVDSTGNFSTNGQTTSSGDSLQYIEIYNNSDEVADVGGYILEHNSNTDPSTLYQFPAGTELPARSYTVIAKNAKAVEGFFKISGVDQWDSGQSLGQSSDYIGVVNSVNTVIDSHTYSEQTSPGTPGDSTNIGGMPTDSTNIGGTPPDTTNIDGTPPDSTMTMPSNSTTYTTIYSIVRCDVSQDAWSNATDSVGEIDSVAIYGNPGRGCTVDTTATTAINNVSSSVSSLMCYPNPANTSLNVKTDKVSAQTLCIFNVYGVMVYESTITNTQTIDTSNWENGIYFVRSGDTTKRIIVNH